MLAQAAQAKAGAKRPVKSTVVQATRDCMGDAPESDQRMPAARFTEQQIERHHRQAQAAQHGAPFKVSGNPAATSMAPSQRAATSG